MTALDVHDIPVAATALAQRTIHAGSVVVVPVRWVGGNTNDMHAIDALFTSERLAGIGGQNGHIGSARGQSAAHLPDVCLDSSQVGKDARRDLQNAQSAVGLALCLNPFVQLILSHLSA